MSVTELVKSALAALSQPHTFQADIDLAKKNLREAETESLEISKINKKVTDTYIKEINTLRFCFDEVLGELGWGDEIEETGIDPLVWARGEIKRLQNREKSLQLRDAANGKCKECGTLHGEPIIHCDVCGAFQ